MTDFSISESIVRDTGSFASVIARRLQRIYKAGFSEILVNRILSVSSKHYAGWPQWDEREVILITYGSSIRNQNELPLKTLHRFLREHLKESMSVVHILPFFPYTSDDGFAVSDYFKVNPVLGSWENIQAIEKDFCLMSDLVINHVSSAHPWFTNFLKQVSPGKDYFIQAEPGMDYSGVTRPRSSPLFTKFETSSGASEVWTTFSAGQVDLNFSNPEVLLEMIRIMLFYIAEGTRFIRLDAIAYLWKCSGTSCLHLNETHEVVKLLRDIATFVRPGTVILTETNVPNRENWSYFGNSDEAHMVYQFSLPPLLLHALYYQNSEYLTQWAFQIPEVGEDQTFLNYTSSHDGIGVRPLEGLVPDAAISGLIRGMQRFGGLVSKKTNSDGTLSPYEINITWFDAMKGTAEGEDHLHENRFLSSQAIMLALKGIPAFYIHSLLASSNNLDGVESTGQARSINRAEIPEKDLASSLFSGTTQSRIFNELKRMIGIRKSNSAFHPRSRQRILNLGGSVFAFLRDNDEKGQKVYCLSNIGRLPLQTGQLQGEIEKGYDLLSGEVFSPSDHIPLKPYQTRWVSFCKPCPQGTC